MRQKLNALNKLTRWKEYVGSCVLVTALGIASSTLNTSQDVGIVIKVLLANLTSFMFAFMINDIEDADDDAKDPAKVKRNPISAKLLKINEAYFFTALMALVSLALFVSINKYTFAIGAGALTIGFLYSWKKVRFKSIPIIDVISHAMFLALLGFLAAATSGGVLRNPLVIVWAGICLFIFSCSEDIRNELRDFENDKISNIKNTVQTLNLFKYRNLLSYFTVIIGLLLAHFIIWSLSPTGRLVTFAALLIPFVNFLWSLFGSKRSNMYNYPYMQLVFICVSFILILDTLGIF